MLFLAAKGSGSHSGMRVIYQRVMQVTGTWEQLM